MCTLLTPCVFKYVEPFTIPTERLCLYTVFSGLRNVEGCIPVIFFRTCVEGVPTQRQDPKSISGRT